MTERDQCMKSWPAGSIVISLSYAQCCTACSVDRSRYKHDRAEERSVNLNNRNIIPLAPSAKLHTGGKYAPYLTPSRTSQSFVRAERKMRGIGLRLRGREANFSVWKHDLKIGPQDVESSRLEIPPLNPRASLTNERYQVSKSFYSTG